MKPLTALPWERNVTPLKGQRSIADVVREYFPDIDAGEMDFVLWNQTGYPAFWSSPTPDNSPEDCLRHDLARLKWDMDNCQPTGIERTEALLAHMHKEGADSANCGDCGLESWECECLR